MKLLSLLVLSFILISCEGEKGGASSEAESTPVSKTLGSDDITDSYYGTYITECYVNGSASSIADDVRLTIVIDANGTTITEEIYVGGGLGCLPGNLVTTLTHDSIGEFEVVSSLNEDGEVVESNKLSLEVIDTVFTMEHIVFDDYNCGGVIIDNVGDSEMLPVGGCEYSRTGDQYEFNFSGELPTLNISNNGSNIQGLLLSSLELTKQ